VSNPKTDNETLLALEFDSEESGKPLVEYVRLLCGKLEVLWLNKWSIVLTSILGFAIAAGVSLLMPAKYVATAYFLPPDMNPASGMDLLIGMKTGGAAMGGMGTMFNDMVGTRTPGQLYFQEMQSRSVEDSLIKRLDLNRVYRAKQKEAARKALEGSTKFNEDRKSGILSVQVTDKDPTRAAAIANGYAEELGRFLSDIDSAAGRREREYFEVQLVIAREQLERASKALGEFSGKNSVLDLPLQDNAAISSAAAIQGRLIAEEAQLDGLLQIYTENNVRVKETRAQVARLQRQLEQVQGKRAASSAPASTNTGGGGSADDSSSKMEQLAGLSTEYMDLYREAKTAESMVETLTQQYEIAKLEETRHITKVQLLDPAQPPELKTFPKRGRMSIIGMFVGFLIGVGYVLARNWWQTTSEDNEWKKLLRSIWNRFTLRRDQAGVLTER
jgi:uncharacterized protein involved in exopolysaccharide biosynthesis